MAISELQLAELERSARASMTDEGIDAAFLSVAPETQLELIAEIRRLREKIEFAYPTQRQLTADVLARADT